MKMKIIIVTLLLMITAASSDKFNEELLLTQLNSGHLNAFFKFSTLVPGDKWSHYDMVSRPLGDLVQVYNVEEMTVSLTQGMWMYQQWGYPVHGSPPGASVRARFTPEVRSDQVDTMWEGLTDGLAGLLCTSLNKLDKTQVVQPVYSFRPTGVIEPDNNNETHSRYAQLPRENVCTENLTPWKKLLPCKGKRGLAVLLNSGVIQKHSSYQSISIMMRPVCSNQYCQNINYEFSQELNVVFDPAIYNKDPANTDWSLKQLFGIGLSGICPMADNSYIYVDMTHAKFTLKPVADRDIVTGDGSNNRKYAVFDLKKWSHDGRIKDLSGSHMKPHIYGNIPSPVVTVNRFYTGLGRDRGGIQTTIKNNGPTSLTVSYLDVLPWYLRMYSHTLTIITNHNLVQPEEIYFKPGLDRKRPYHLELLLTLPPKSTTRINYQLELSMLRWVEYPPDANHGFYIGSACLTARINDIRNMTKLGIEDSSLSFAIWGNPSNVNDVITLYTEILLLSLPTPDFSMPYNVICLACTVAALAFGPIHNITTKSLTLLPPAAVEQGILKKIFSFIRKSKKSGEEIIVNVESEENNADNCSLTIRRHSKF